MTAILDYPVTVGYLSWSVQSSRSRGPYIHASVYTAASHIVYSGPSKRQGTFTTPIISRGDDTHGLMDILHAVAAGDTYLRLPMPGGNDTILVQPIDVRPARRDSRGLIGGWSVDWIEVVVYRYPESTLARWYARCDLDYADPIASLGVTLRLETA